MAMLVIALDSDQDLLAVHPPHHQPKDGKANRGMN